jgi:arginine-tRNA-protein transferase
VHGVLSFVRRIAAQTTKEDRVAIRREQLVYDGLQRCPYLDRQVARLPLYRQIGSLDLDEADVRFANGERRVGSSLYRTACPTCSECKSVRVLVDQFATTRSQRRVRARWEGRFRLEMGPATCSEEKLALFNRHKLERGLREADDPPMTALAYVGWLVESCFHTMEMRYFLDDRLVGVGILDLGRRAASSVYFYFDPSPEVSRMSPGVFSVLQEVEFCRSTGREHLYLGLFVRECGHLSYKADYGPQERKLGDAWRRFD